LFAFLFSACGEKSFEQTNTSDPLKKASTNIPFSNKEPKIFQTQIIVTTTVNDDKFEKKYFVARNGEKHITTFNFGEDNENSVVRIENGKSYLIKTREKTYLERKAAPIDYNQSELNKYLTTKWLTEKRNVKFEKLESKNGLTKYSVKIEDSESSEIFIYIDEKLNLPIKQEFFSTSDGTKKLLVTVELKNFKLEANENLFDISERYKNETDK
jgi:hypothetical protein